jgi:hypothetical protein
MEVSRAGHIQNEFLAEKGSRLDLDSAEKPQECFDKLSFGAALTRMSPSRMNQTIIPR